MRPDRFGAGLIGSAKLSRAMDEPQKPPADGVEGLVAGLLDDMLRDGVDLTGAFGLSFVPASEAARILTGVKDALEVAYGVHEWSYAEFKRAYLEGAFAIWKGDLHLKETSAELRARSRTCERVPPQAV